MTNREYLANRRLRGSHSQSRPPYRRLQGKAERHHERGLRDGITVTKKATVIKLDQQPPVQKQLQQLSLTRLPACWSEQNTPVKLLYLSLGNPQESEFVTVLQDGIPLASDWIGFPTLYYLPVPQSVSEIQVIRGGSSLLYGPEPAPAVNFVLKHPVPGSPWNFSSEQIGGSNGLYQTYNVIQEAVGPLEFRLDGSYNRSDGERANSQYTQWQSNLYLGYRPNEDQLFALDFHAGQFDGGYLGRLTIQQFDQDEDQSTAPFDHAWVDRYSVVLRDEWTFAEGWLMQAKGWYTHQDIDNRNETFPRRAALPDDAADRRVQQRRRGYPLPQELRRRHRPPGQHAHFWRDGRPWRCAVQSLQHLRPDGRPLRHFGDAYTRSVAQFGLSGVVHREHLPLR